MNCHCHIFYLSLETKFVCVLFLMSCKLFDRYIRHITVHFSVCDSLYEAACWFTYVFHWAPLPHLVCESAALICIEPTCHQLTPVCKMSIAI